MKQFIFSWKFVGILLGGFFILVVIASMIGGAGRQNSHVPSPSHSIRWNDPASELLFEINLRLAASASSESLSERERNELAGIDLAIQDSWNKEMGYYVYLAPSVATVMSDTQVVAVLSAVRNFRTTRQDKWFDVMIFDDPAIARKARTSILSNLDIPESIWCAQIFSHYRGSYSWNPTNQYESMNLRVGCKWQSLLK
jgi:hypothetical protein